VHDRAPLPIDAADAVANMAYIDAAYNPFWHFDKSISLGGPTGWSGDPLQAVSDPSLGGPTGESLLGAPTGSWAGAPLPGTAAVPHMRVYWSSTRPGEHAVKLSVVGFANTAKAWPAKIAAATPAMTISRRGWSWKDTIILLRAL
jgi:hypothetical protein